MSLCLARRSLDSNLNLKLVVVERGNVVSKSPLLGHLHLSLQGGNIKHLFIWLKFAEQSFQKALQFE